MKKSPSPEPPPQKLWHLEFGQRKWIVKIETLCVHGSKKKYDATGAVAVPIFTAATYAHPGVGESTGFDYTRSGNPTREHLEDTLTALEGGAGAIAFSSGMAAAAALMELFSPGDGVVAPLDLYGGTYRLFETISAKNGIVISYADDFAAAITPATKAIFIETPTNPMMQIIDIARVAKIAGENGLLLIVDNTFLTPYYQRPLERGADIVLHSGTKYLGGHNDALAGFLVARDDEILEKLRVIAKTTGAALSPFDSYLLVRGIKTLAVRMERHTATAKTLAAWLAARREVTAVNYFGLGGMISFSLRDEATAVRILERVRLIQYAESLGGVESLITYPMLQTHADIPEAERVARGIDGKLLRLSVGLESAADLIADLAGAMEGEV